MSGADRLAKIALCSAVYPQPAHIAGQFADGVVEFLRNEPDCVLAFAVENGTDVSAFLPQGVRDSRVLTIHAPPQTPPVALRRLMLEAGMSSGADCLVFCDCDDVVSKSAASLHRRGLRDADISYGDLDLINWKGERLNQSLFGGAPAFQRISGSDSIAQRNVFGLSNTAVRSSVFAGGIPEIPQSVVAVDWYLFTVLLDQGAHAAYAGGSVASYRQYVDNTLGASAAVSSDQLAKRLTIAERHFQALPTTRARQEAELALRRVRQELDKESGAIQETMTLMPPLRAWYEDLFGIAAQLADHTEG